MNIKKLYSDTWDAICLSKELVFGSYIASIVLIVLISIIAPMFIDTTISVLSNIFSWSSFITVIYILSFGLTLPMMALICDTDEYFN